MSQLEVSFISLNDSLYLAGEDIYFSLGNLSFNYKLKSDLSNFDKILLSNALIEVVIQAQFESLEIDHMQILTVCCGDPRDFQNSHQSESWFQVFKKMKDYLLVSICDPELCEQGLVILHNFLTADALKFQVFEVSNTLSSKRQLIRILEKSSPNLSNCYTKEKAQTANRNSDSTCSPESLTRAVSL